MNTSTAVSEHELERLSAVLADDRLPDAMPLDAVQGMLYAIASGPKPLVMPEAWLPQAVGTAPQWRDDAERLDIETLLRRFASESEHDLMTADDSLPIILFGDDEPDYATWAQGYLDGVDAAGERWFSDGQAEAVDTLLFPFRVLAGEVGPDERAAFNDREWRLAERAAREDLVGAVLEVWHYWFDRGIDRTPVRRAEPKLGRNDPCHCGSGRKFKQCHGKDA